MKIKNNFKVFKSLYVILSIIVLFGSSLLWSILGAQLQSSNADQIIDSHLFQDIVTFHGALFPNTHTFLIKWPLFLLLRLFDHADLCMIILTVLTCLATVGGLAYIMYRIDRRPMVFSSLLLALSGILLLIPAQPYSGGILPVNFAMLTTRNIEYLFYIASLILLIRAPRIRSWGFVCSLIVLSLLISSDKLFLSLSVGGSLIMLAVYGISRRLQFVKLAFRWLVLGILAGIIATILLRIITASGLTTIVGQGDLGPYGFIGGIKQLGLGVIFVVLGTLTNFGANPVFDISIVKEIPSVFRQRLLEPATFSCLLNGALFIFGLIASWRLFAMSLLRSKSKSEPDVKAFPVNKAAVLSLFLVSSSLAAIVIFIATNHYYAVDARYLTITLFALFISIATYLRSQPLPSKFVFRIITIILIVGISFGIFWTINIHQQQSAALDNISARNQTIINVLKNHKTDILVGDYWRVVPIAQEYSVASNIIPLSNCTTPRTVLTSTEWQSGLDNHSFVYLLSLDRSLTDYPQCSIDQVVGSYGVPNASMVIAGTYDNPTELLLFYDAGIGSERYKPKNFSSTIRTITPVAPNKPSSDCVEGITVMNIVAHQDDDILFMNPDLMKHIDAGYCIRTVYLTAGDAGQNSQYWLGRERAAQAAYASLLGISQDEIWIQKTIKLADDEFITSTSPRGNGRISLIFMRLPDGNISSRGFDSSNHESLASLISGRLTTIHTVDGQSDYTSDQLTGALSQIMETYEPNEIDVQAMDDMGRIFHDHSDHITVGQYVERAKSKYISNHANNTSSYYYVGYPIREMPVNVTGDYLTRKINAFLAYGKFDGYTCHSVSACMQDSTYWSYLNRQYTIEQWNDSKTRSR